MTGVQTCALPILMDKTECLIFMNTLNSITAKGLIEQTESPWIYSEISISQMIQKRPTGREQIMNAKRETKFMSEKVLNEDFPTFRYTPSMSHLTELDFSKLEMWYLSQVNNKHPLDILYDQNPKVKS